MSEHNSTISASRLPYWILALAAISIAMLVCTLFYPMGYDQAVFTVGAERILHGALPYRDILDTKPPLIFYIYSIASGLFGHHIWSIRLFDVIYQLGTIYYFYRILIRSKAFDWTADSKTIAAIAAILTMLQYVGSGFWMTSQTESFALLPSLVIVDCIVRTLQNPGKLLTFAAIAGLSAAVLFLLKFTFLMVPIAAVCYLLVTEKRIVAIRFLGTLVAVFVAIIGIYIAFLDVSGALRSASEALAWVVKYGSIEPLLSISTIREGYYTLFPSRLIATHTLAVFVLGVVGLALYIKKTQKQRNGKPNSVAMLFALIWIFQIVGVLVERKFFQYHFTRAFWAFSPFAAVGIRSVTRTTKVFIRNSREQEIFSRITRLFLILVPTVAAVFFSPITQMFSQPLQWAALSLIHRNVAETVEKRIPDYHYEEQQQVGAYLSSKMGTSDNIFFWGNDVGVYFFANRLPTTPCLTATPLRTSWTPLDWKRNVVNDLDQHPPRFFISEFGDPKEYITGDSTDSYSALKAWPELFAFLHSNYDADTTIGHFYIYRRR